MASGSPRRQASARPPGGAGMAERSPGGPVRARRASRSAPPGAVSRPRMRALRRIQRRRRGSHSRSTQATGTTISASAARNATWPTMSWSDCPASASPVPASAADRNGVFRRSPTSGTREAVSPASSRAAARLSPELSTFRPGSASSMIASWTARANVTAAAIRSTAIRSARIWRLRRAGVWA